MIAPFLKILFTKLLTADFFQKFSHSKIPTYTVLREGVASSVILLHCDGGERVRRYVALHILLWNMISKDILFLLKRNTVTTVLLKTYFLPLRVMGAYSPNNLSLR